MVSGLKNCCFYHRELVPLSQDNSIYFTIMKMSLYTQIKTKILWLNFLKNEFTAINETMSPVIVPFTIQLYSVSYHLLLMWVMGETEIHTMFQFCWRNMDSQAETHRKHTQTLQDSTEGLNRNQTNLLGSRLGLIIFTVHKITLALPHTSNVIPHIGHLASYGHKR